MEATRVMALDTLAEHSDCRLDWNRAVYRYEMSRYIGLRDWAAQLGHAGTVELLEGNLDEEEARSTDSGAEPRLDRIVIYPVRQG